MCGAVYGDSIQLWRIYRMSISLRNAATSRIYPSRGVAVSFSDRICANFTVHINLSLATSIRYTFSLRAILTEVWRLMSYFCAWYIVSDEAFTWFNIWIVHSFTPAPVCCPLNWLLIIRCYCLFADAIFSLRVAYVMLNSQLYQPRYGLRVIVHFYLEVISVRQFRFFHRLRHHDFLASR